MNKSKLLASTMLVSAAALMAAGSANALSLKVGGFGEFWAGVADQDNAAKTAKGGNIRNGFDVKQDSEFHFKAEETLDNGIKVGVRYEFEAGTGNDNSKGDGFDESIAYAKTKWGQINIGGNDQATGYVGGVSVVGPVGLVKSDANDWAPGVKQQLTDTDVDLGLSDAQNITYFTPRVAGVQVVVSYAPDASDKGAGTPYDSSEATGLNNAWSGALLYGAKFGKVSLKVQGGLTHVKNNGAGGSGVGDGGDASTTLDGHAAHVKVGFGPVSVTGAYSKENLNTNNAMWYGVGVIFKAGMKDQFSAGWGHGETMDVQGTTDVENDIITVGWQRNLGKGVSLAASVFNTETTATGKDPSAFGGVGGFKLSF